MDGSGMFGGSSLFGGLGAQPSAAKANTNVFGAVSFGSGQQSAGCSMIVFLSLCSV